MSDLLLSQIVMRYGTGHVVSGASLDVGAGEFVAVTGPAQSGKSALLRVIAGLERPDEGTVRLGDDVLTQHEPFRVAAVLPGVSLPGDTLRDALEGPLRQAGVSDREILRRTRLAAEVFGLEEHLNRPLAGLDAELSRRAQFARAIASEPDAIVIDTELSELRSELEATILDELLRLRGGHGTAVVYATADSEEALRVGDRIAVMNKGRLEQVGDRESLILRPASAEVAQHVRPDLELHPANVEGSRIEIPDLGTKWQIGGLPHEGEVLVAATRGALERDEAPEDVLFFDPKTLENLSATPAARPPMRLTEGAREAAAAGSEPRYVNVRLRDGEADVAATDSLRTKDDYTVRVDIGPLRADSLVTNPGHAPWPDEYLPESDDGHWLQIVASSTDFSIKESVRRIFLPRHGSAWVCACPAEGPHNCEPASRVPYVDFALRSPGQPGRARLRLTAYYELNAVQSMLLTARVAEDGAHACVVDFSLTAHLAGVSGLHPRALSIVTNDDERGEHVLYVNGRTEEPFSHSLSDGQIATTAGVAREYLFAAHIVPGSRDKLAYGPRNEKSRDKFVADLQKLASVGYDLLTGAFPILDKRNRLVESLRQASLQTEGKAVIQVARTSGSTLAYPWPLVYEIPVSVHAKPTGCPFLDTWDPDSPPAELPPRCPREDAHATGVLCPYGFWGFAHIIELPPFVDQDVPVRNSIRTEASDSPVTVAIGVSPELDKRLTESHLTALEALMGEQLETARAARDILVALGKDVDVAYFYCHGENEQTPEGQIVGPLLKLAKGDYIRPQDVFGSNPPQGPWPDDHWKRVRPLVFINGCHTTSLTPDRLSDFVKTFVGSRAAGVLGTEVSIHQQVANEAAQEFLRALRAEGSTVGEALRRMRRVLLAKGNVMGLAYNAYCSAGLSVQPSGANGKETG